MRPQQRALGRPSPAPAPALLHLMDLPAVSLEPGLERPQRAARLQQGPGGKPSVATVTELQRESLCIVTTATTVDRWGGRERRRKEREGEKEEEEREKIGSENYQLM